MRIRHKIPSVFNLAMVDVLCCALGCVILIWLLNSKLAADEAEEHAALRARAADEARSARDKNDKALAALRGDKALQAAQIRAILTERDKAVAFAAKLTDRIAELEADRRALRDALANDKKALAGLTSDLGKAKVTAADLEKALKAMTGRYEKEKLVTVTLNRDLLVKLARLKAAEASLGKTRASAADTEKDLKAMMDRYEKEKRVTVTLNRDLAEMLARINVAKADLDKSKDREKQAAARAELFKKSVDVKERDLLALASLLEDARNASKALKKTLDARDLELAASKDTKLDLQKLLRLRQIALDDAGKSLKRLENEKLVLRTAVENRFAGIELAGKRVIFLIDTSGSMVLLDAKTDAPNKWREVRNTLTKLMKSMPGLEKYQIITFAAAPRYLMGKPGEWLDFDRAETPARVARALEAITPDGGTNMYAALDQAFSFRKKGLQAVYLLSDGLPNLGEGLPTRGVRELSDVEKGQLLGRAVRNKLDSDWNRSRPGLSRVQIHTVGFFYESPDLGSFLWALARENNGNFVGMSKP